ncbi:multipass membrane protein [Cuniculiplasma divulgatum]|jgi:hypothetical protein|uniref:Multipass membrane protein n=2 Tax=Cuniculiplasma divulgatum TaxID=1673428 RepID=A0A1N5S5Q6_9ARCH|nr:MAG: hypothetical protein AMDU5_GPLC00004G0369 [Thermoplasmatales archaeon Gpl]SIM31316.1 multipass membrane protein [Cuniculiplasma divulgatum]SJK83960.1 multipass membrane protein [Cuniculiplasma divulgatum]
MRNNNLRYYSITYLFHLNGGIRGIFFSRGSLDFYISLLIVSILTLFHKLHPMSTTEVIFVIGLDVALLGLILATYAIIYSIQDENYLSALIASRNYQYLLFQTSWSSYWIFLSIPLFGFIEMVYYNVTIQALALFAIIYGFLGTFVLITKALRKIAITAARKSEKLMKSWEEAEKNN